MTNTKPTQNIATHKIFAFVVFICAAIMASIFIYHSNQKAAQPPLSPAVGTLFSVSRDIKPFDLVTNNDGKMQTFTNKDFYHHWTLLFFGFAHCASVCPITLNLMQRIYPTLHDNYPNLRIAFVSVDPDRDSPQAISQYTQRYNPAFIGITGKIQNIRQLQSQLGIYSARDNSSATSSGNYQIQHTSSILLINPEGEWAGLFKFGLKPNDLIQGFETAVNYYQKNHA